MTGPNSQVDVCHLPLPGERIEPPELPPEVRKDTCEEVEQPFEASQAQREASRCLSSITCTYCEVCQLICPDLCITRNPETGLIEFDLTYCKGCGLCAAYCPKGAIDMVREEQ